MSRPVLLVRSIGPNATLQDMGREGFLAFGLSRGGAADRLAMVEGAAILGQRSDLAALEMPTLGGTFEALEDVRVSLTGAEMRLDIDGAPVRWNASHQLPKGSVLTVGATQSGGYGYLHIGGGFSGTSLLGSQSVQVSAGLGKAVTPNSLLRANPDIGAMTGMFLTPAARFSGGELRVVPSLQTGFFEKTQLERFQTTAFSRGVRANRMGVRMEMQGQGFHVEGGLNVVSEIVVPGDIQVTGDGAPYVLLSECQTTGGYPRIGTVLPCDLPKVAQAPLGSILTFRFVGLDEGLQLNNAFERDVKSIANHIAPLIRDPHDIPDLLAYQLISGVTAGDTELEDA